jgi:hypothetical protein
VRFPNWPRWVWRCYAGTAAAVAAFVVCSLWPMWVTRHFNAWEGVGVARTLWGMLSHLGSALRTDGEVRVTLAWETPAVVTAATMHLAAIVGAVLGGVRWRKGNEPHPSSPSP